MSKTYYYDNCNTINAFNVEVSNNSTPLNVVSLFSGAGGMDLGFVGNFDYLGEHYQKIRLMLFC